MRLGDTKENVEFERREKSMRRLGKKKKVAALSIETFSCGCVGCDKCTPRCVEGYDREMEEYYTNGRNIYNVDIYSSLKQ